jgi:serine-type anaerobic sulfatase-maturating enzyme
VFPLASANQNESIKKMSLVADNIPPANPPPGFHLLAKPSGSTCNIDCKYCFFLLKEALYPNYRQRMSEDILETYIRQLVESRRTPK